MKRLLLPLLAALTLVGCQSGEEKKSISECIETTERTNAWLSPNDIRSLCECTSKKYYNQDGNTSMFRASQSCLKDLGLDKKIEDEVEDILGIKKEKKIWAFDSKSEAEKEAKKLGCTGAHKMGNKWMPCGAHVTCD